MRLGIRRKLQQLQIGGGISTRQSYEDIDGLVVSAGVITALSLSFVLALQYMIVPELCFKINFHSLICCEEGFRAFAMSTMKWYDTGGHKEERFYDENPFPLAADGGDMFNVTSVILERAPKIFPKANEDNEQFEKCLTDAEINIAIELMVVKFPQHLMNAWVLRHPEAYLWSAQTEKLASWACSLCIVSFWWSLVLYMSLVSGPAREDETGSALKAWNWLGVPTLAVTYLLLLIGIVLFLQAHMRLAAAQSSNIAHTYANVIDKVYQFIIPMGITGLLLSLASNFLSWVKNKSNASLNQGESPPSAGASGSSTMLSNLVRVSDEDVDVTRASMHQPPLEDHAASGLPGQPIS